MTFAVASLLAGSSSSVTAATPLPPVPPAATPAGQGGPPVANTPAAAAGASLVEEVRDIVERNFYSQERLAHIGWRGAVDSAKAAFAKAPDPASRTAVLRTLLATLATSHTEFYPRDDPSYWALASIFEPMLTRACEKDRLPSLPISLDDIGVSWKQVGTEWFVGGVYAGGAAEKAGLRVGDRIVAADGRPFSPVLAFAGKPAKPVRIEVERTRGGAPTPIEVVPRPMRPQEEFARASAASFRVIEYRDRQIAYVRVWTWTSIEIQRLLLDAIAQSNAASVDGFILDLRDGWGGAATHYLGMFFENVPVLGSVARDGKVQRFDYRIRRPAVLLINGGTRSGKETIAYGAKKHRLATLVGERTAGAVMFGRPFCLSDGSMLLLAVADAEVDGERLEGRGVSPDIEVPFDFRYSGGRDPQLERALEVVSEGRADRPKGTR